MMSANSWSFNINESTAWGKFLTADKHYVIGDLILDESPLLIGPVKIESNKNDCEKVEDKISLKNCVGCCKRITELSLACIDCGWPICCDACTDEPLHKRYECAVFKNNQIAPNLQNSLQRLIIIRACLLYKDEQNISSWKDFTAMSSELDKQTDDFKEVVKKETRSSTKWINDVCKLEIDATTIETIITTLILNGFSMYEKDENNWYTAEVLYKTGSLFAHSCCPNADWFILPTNQNGIKRFNLRIYARRNISCNEPITIPYIQDYLNSDTAFRKKVMAEKFHFECRCQRCNDSSEFYLYTSALRCQNCGNEKLLADDPSHTFSFWTCGDCGERTSYVAVKCYNQTYTNALQSVLRDKSYSGRRESGLEHLLTWLNKSNFTANHRVITRTLYFWLKLQKFKDLLEHTKESQLKFIQILERAKKCLKMYRMFSTLPNIVSIELAFAYAIAAYFFKTESLCTIEYVDYTPEEKRQIVAAIYAHMKIAVQIIEWNPYNTAYIKFRDVTLTRFSFWEKNFKAANVVRLMAVEDVDHKMPSDEIQGIGAKMSLLNQIKVSLAKFCGWIFQWSIPAIKDSKVTPDVSLLEQWDFYFDN